MNKNLITSIQPNNELFSCVKSNFIVPNFNESSSEIIFDEIEAHNNLNYTTDVGLKDLKTNSFAQIDFSGNIK